MGESSSLHSAGGSPGEAAQCLEAHGPPYLTAGAAASDPPGSQLSRTIPTQLLVKPPERLLARISRASRGEQAWQSAQLQPGRRLSRRLPSTFFLLPLRLRTHGQQARPPLAGHQEQLLAAPSPHYLPQPQLFYTWLAGASALGRPSEAAGSSCSGGAPKSSGPPPLFNRVLALSGSCGNTPAVEAPSSYWARHPPGDPPPSPCGGRHPSTEQQTFSSIMASSPDR